MSKIGRRELVAGGGALAFGSLGFYAWTEFDPNSGRVDARELRADGRTLIFEDGQHQRLDGFFAEVADDPSDLLVTDHLSRLKEEYDDVVYRFRIDSEESDCEWFRTADVSTFDTLSVGDYVAFQVSVTDPCTLRGLSCVAEDEESLETRCDFEEVEIPEDGNRSV